MGWGQALASIFGNVAKEVGATGGNLMAEDRDYKRKLELLKQAFDYKQTPEERTKDMSQAKYYEALAKTAGMGGGGGNPFAAIYAISNLLGGLGKLQGKDAGGYQVTGSSSGSGGYVNPYNYTRQPTR